MYTYLQQALTQIVKGNEGCEYGSALWIRTASMKRRFRQRLTKGQNGFSPAVLRSRLEEKLPLLHHHNAHFSSPTKSQPKRL